MIESASRLYASAHKDVRVCRDLADGLPEVVLDAEQMKRVFINLLENSVEAMGGKGTIRIASRYDAHGGWRRSRFADDGPGISAEDMPKLFQPDFSRKKKKSGLGLAIVLRIIKDHSGSIRVEQNQPKGAKFVIELPVAGVGEWKIQPQINTVFQQEFFVIVIG